MPSDFSSTILVWGTIRAGSLNPYCPTLSVYETFLYFHLYRNDNFAGLTIMLLLLFILDTDHLIFFLTLIYDFYEFYQMTLNYF